MIVPKMETSDLSATTANNSKTQLVYILQVFSCKFSLWMTCKLLTNCGLLLFAVDRFILDLLYSVNNNILLEAFV